MTNSPMKPQNDQQHSGKPEHVKPDHVKPGHDDQHQQQSLPASQPGQTEKKPQQQS